MKFFNFHDKIYLFALKQKSRQCFENLRFIYAPIVNKKKLRQNTSLAFSLIEIQRIVIYMF